MKESEEVLSLCKRIQNGDDEAFEPLVRKYEPLIAAETAHFLPSLGVYNGVKANEASVDPEEVRQDCILSLYKSAVSYSPTEQGNDEVTFGLYAKICMKNAMISRVRKYRRALGKIEKLNASFMAPTSLKAAYDSEQMSEKMREAVDDMSDYEKKVFRLYLDGLTISRIAEETGRNEKSAVNALYRVKTKIRKKTIN